MIDAQSGEDGWIVPLAVTAALFDDPAASETAYRAVKPLAETRGRVRRRVIRYGGRRPARSGRPGAARPPTVCFAAALDALPRIGASPAVQEAVSAFAARYVDQGRCPADDLPDPCRALGGSLSHHRLDHRLGHDRRSTACAPAFGALTARDRPAPSPAASTTLTSPPSTPH